MTNRIWWKEQVIYQIYPRSFKDSNGDGIGDLQGIIGKLDYLKDLGVDIIWVCPIYQSPNDDNGYDISDYREIHPEFGTMADFDELLAGLHQRGMKLIMDLVVNHTSDEHHWFEESRKSKDNQYRDYYFWKKGKDGGPPNNWTSFFGGSAWEYDALTDEYYLHIFSRKQPDVNWENPKVRAEMCDVMKYWLDKGIDGFRMDVVPLISKRLDFADTPYEVFGDTVKHIYSNGPKVHQYINEMYEKVLKHYDVLTVGEGPGISSDVALNYVGSDRGELNMIFHLDHMFLGFGKQGRFDQHPYSLQQVKDIFIEWDNAIGDSGWISIFLDNHDFARMVSRFGNDNTYRVQSAKLLALLVLTMRGTPCIYQGSEIGMTNVDYQSIEDLDDVEAKNFFKIMQQEKGTTAAEFLAIANEFGRDNVRTPIQWDDTIHGGFTRGTPWIKANPNYKDINVAQALTDQDSIYHFYKDLLSYRKGKDALIYGDVTIINTIEELMVYKRTLGTETYTVVLNVSNQNQEVDFDIKGKVVISNYEGVTGQLRPWEARMYKV